MKIIENGMIEEVEFTNSNDIITKIILILLMII
jgi:hypothetical protein